MERFAWYKPAMWYWPPLAHRASTWARATSTIGVSPIFLKKNNVRFVVLCENLSISGIGTAGIPDIQKRTLILNINFNPKYFERVIHHEVFHMIYDSHPILFDDNLWKKFNDKSFQYAGCSICSDSIGLDEYKETDGFITEYSKTIPSEDMAEIYSFIIKKENILTKLSEKDEKLWISEKNAVW